jgi:N-acetylglucosamine-6-sulfatase
MLSQQQLAIRLRTVTSPTDHSSLPYTPHAPAPSDKDRWPTDRLLPPLILLWVGFMGMLVVWPHVTAAGLVKPNILLLLSDDQRAESIACMPNLQKLVARRGVTFTQAYASTPLCCPGRSSILTGLYAHNHGIRANGGAVKFGVEGNEDNVVARFVRAQGYLTGYFGKYLQDILPLVEAQYVPPYWDEWHIFAGGAAFYNFSLFGHGQDFPTPKRVCYLSHDQTSAACTTDADDIVRGAEHHADDVLQDKVLRFMDQAVAARKPFFAIYAPKTPHGPSSAPDRYQPPGQKEQAVFTQAALDRLTLAGPQCTALFHYTNPPPSFSEADLSDKPEWVQALNGGVSTNSAHKFRQRQIVSSLATDDAISAFVTRLTQAGQLSNTVIIYTTDNGFSWRDHGYTGKNCTYEGCARLPLVVRHPQTPQAGSRRNQFLMNIDIAPTIAALAGNPMPSTVPLRDRTVSVNGKSFAGLLDGSSTAWPRQELLLECWGHEGKPPHAAIRDAQWKYIEHYADEGMTRLKTRSDDRTERELYDPWHRSLRTGQLTPPVVVRLTNQGLHPEPGEGYCQWAADTAACLEGPVRSSGYASKPFSCYACRHVSCAKPHGRDDGATGVACASCRGASS